MMEPAGGEPVIEDAEGASAALMLGHEHALMDLLRREAATVLNRPDVELSADATFHDLGFDSVSLMELCNRLNARIEATLPVTVFFDHPTLKEFSHELRRLMESER